MSDTKSDNTATAESTDTSTGLSAEEGLRMIRAFMRIKNPEDRARLIEQAEALSRN